MEKGVSFLVTVALMALASSFASASDPSPLQDTCVAIDEPKNAVLQDPNLTVAEDFFSKGLNIPGNTSNLVGSSVTTVNVDVIPGLNTLGISLGTLLVGFVTSNPQNRLFSKVLNKGDVFVFPIGLIHFQFNIGHFNAVAIAGLSSQNPGVITIANAVFGSNPPINSDFLAKAFQLDKKVVEFLQARF
ncbi:Germin-like protein subfamily 1 member 7 [Vitis vinifera]|uniref:Germin-like protein n=1 Tax=Vitis vinifera TaxID=29760 RepID=A0A438KCA8_VITVI|nr:Germin-like protein subfamily 1 member 7 [Vitis vinifera]